MGWGTSSSNAIQPAQTREIAPEKKEAIQKAMLEFKQAGKKAPKIDMNYTLSNKFLFLLFSNECYK